MQKIRRVFIIYISILYLSLFLNNTFGQTADYLASKNKLYQTLKSSYIGPRFTESIDKFYNKTCDSLVNKVRQFEGMPMDLILSRLFASCNEELARRSITKLRITAVNNLLTKTIKQYRTKPLSDIYENAGIIPCKILSNAFSGSVLGDSIQDIASIREMIHYPLFIISRIKQPRFESYRDTLLYYLANREPMALIKKLSTNDSAFTKLVESSANRTVRSIAALPSDVNLNRILPFALAMYENRISLDSVRQLVMNPLEYYTALTEEMTYLKNSKDTETKNFLRLPLINLNANFARDFYINAINDLHEKPDQVRFKTLENLSAKELYFIILGGEDELYTSSFIYMFKLFLKKAEAVGLDQFFDEISYYNFDHFLSILTIYGMEHELIKRLKEPAYAKVMKKALSSLADPLQTDDDLQVNAMYLAEIFQKTRDFQQARIIITRKLDSLQDKHKKDNLLYRIYGALRDIQAGTGQIMNEEKESIYDKLAISELISNNQATEVSLFYDDDDGISSFNSFCATFDAATWQKEDMGDYVVFRSLKGVNKMVAYANKPNTDAGSDTAQMHMMEAIRDAGFPVTIFIHRGHSYHLANSLSMLSPTAQLIYLGSCGGYQNVMNAFSNNHSSQFIATRKIGSKLINDPLLKKIHKDILDNNDINWREYWSYFEKYFQSKQTKDLFSGYNPPYKFYGMMFIRSVFNF